ncbi:MAG: ATP-binding protein [Acidobacteriaceae bacterium]
MTNNGPGAGAESSHSHRVVFHHDKLKMKLDVVLPADEALIAPTVKRIMEAVSEIDCSKGKEFEIETALLEALANAVRHGAKGDATKKVECVVACEEPLGMLIIVRDPGEGFDPKLVPNPTQGDAIFNDHGRGIYMINQLMDEVKFEKNGTEIHMRKF